MAGANEEKVTLTLGKTDALLLQGLLRSEQIRFQSNNVIKTMLDRLESALDEANRSR